MPLPFRVHVSGEDESDLSCLSSAQGEMLPIAGLLVEDAKSCWNKQRVAKLGKQVGLRARGF